MTLPGWEVEAGTEAEVDAGAAEVVAGTATEAGTVAEVGAGAAEVDAGTAEAVAATAEAAVPLDSPISTPDTR